MATKEEFLALRSDIAKLTTAIEALSASVDPDNLTKVIATNFVAQFQSLADQLVADIAAKTKTTKTSRSKAATTSDDDDNDDKKTPGKMIHCNYSKMPHSSWSSFKIYFLQMKKHYPEHLQDILPNEIWDAAIGTDAVKEIEAKEKATDHQKAKAFVTAVWNLDKGMQDKATEILKADLAKENDVRNKGAFKHVGSETQTPEEAALEEKKD